MYNIYLWIFFFQQTLSQWNKVFYLSGAITIISGLVYIFFGTSDVQKWNTYNYPLPNEKEMKLIIKKPKKVNTSKI